MRSYTIKSVSQSGDTAQVRASITDASGTVDGVIPLQKEGGDWKVCFSSATSSPPAGSVSEGASGGASVVGSTPPAAPIPTDPQPSISVTTPSSPGFCANSDPFSVANSYAVSAAGGGTDVAQQCVYRNVVPISVAESLDATNLRADNPNSAGPTFTFTSVDGSTHASVTVTKESDGNYYVTKASKN